MLEAKADVVVIGGGLGGCMAALAVAKSGFNVILTEETDWLGGQLTSQAVPPDEHPWIEEFGCTATYRDFRNKVRNFYKRNYPLKSTAMEAEHLNPGQAWVSRLSHEPRVALSVLEEMLAPYVNSGKIRLLLQYVPIESETAEDSVQSITVCSDITDEKIRLFGLYFLDATECGDVLPLADAEYVTGAESRQDTGEPHALESADPLDMQAITYVFAVDYVEGEDFTIKKPENYDFWKSYIPRFSDYPLLSWYAVNSADTSTLKKFTMFPNEAGIPALFTYRRVLDKQLLCNPIYEGDVSLINWPQNDYFLSPVLEVSAEQKKKGLEEARQLSYSLLYWLQTEAPRLDGKLGYPGLRLRKDVLGTEDGLAKHPYIRESRRIKAVQTITENDVSREVRGSDGIRTYEDSVGVGSYHLDLHHTTKTNRTFYIPSYPYEIPLGALLPIRMKNLLPACKNIGTTQIANGCYRLHPTEWNIGESAGFLTVYALQHDVRPHDVREDSDHLASYQDLLKKNGVQIHWPEMEL